MESVCLLHARSCFRCLMHINLFNLHNNSVREILLLSPPSACLVAQPGLGTLTQTGTCSLLRSGWREHSKGITGVEVSQGCCAGSQPGNFCSDIVAACSSYQLLCNKPTRNFRLTRITTVILLMNLPFGQGCVGIAHLCLT